VLAGTSTDLSKLVERYGTVASVFTGGFAGLVLLVVFLVGAMLVWAELVVRSALVYLLVAFAPLTLAARVWPSTRGMFRRLCELGVALIVSKFAVSLALALGAVALIGGGTSGTEGQGLSLAGMLGGATLMGLAAFTPFVVLRILPMVESAVVAQGVSRSPVRGAQSAMAASAYPARLARLAGGGALAAGGAAAATSSAPELRAGTSGPAASARRLAGGDGGVGRPPAPLPAGDGPPSVRHPQALKGSS
jgi:hypothetical protein